MTDSCYARVCALDHEGAPGLRACTSPVGAGTLDSGFRKKHALQSSRHVRSGMRRFLNAISMEVLLDVLCFSLLRVSTPNKLQPKLTAGSHRFNGMESPGSSQLPGHEGSWHGSSQDVF